MVLEHGIWDFRFCPPAIGFPSGEADRDFGLGDSGI